MSRATLHSKAAQEPGRFDALEKAGFLLDRDGDIIYQIFERFGGHYMDVGTSARIASGQVCQTLPPTYFLLMLRARLMKL